MASTVYETDACKPEMILVGGQQQYNRGWVAAPACESLHRLYLTLHVNARKKSY